MLHGAQSACSACRASLHAAKQALTISSGFQMPNWIDLTRLTGALLGVKRSMVVAMVPRSWKPPAAQTRCCSRTAGAKASSQPCHVSRWCSCTAAHKHPARERTGSRLFFVGSCLICCFHYVQSQSVSRRSQ